MTFDYAETAADALEVLQEFGASTTLTRQQVAVAPTYDPSTATVTPPAAIVDTVTAVVFPVSGRLINGTSIRAGDRTAYIGAVGVSEPRAGDVLAWSGQKWAVVDSKPLAPAGVAVLYEALVRVV